MKLLFVLYTIISITLSQRIFRVGCVYNSIGRNAPSGLLLRNSYEMWRDNVNARGGLRVKNESYTVELVFGGIDGTPISAQNATEYLADNYDLNYIFLPFSTALSIPAAIVAHDRGINSIYVATNSLSAYICMDDQAYPCAQPFGRRFPLSTSVSYPLSKVVSDAMNLLKFNGAKTAAIFFLDITWGRDVVDGVRRVANLADVDLLYSGGVPFTTNQTLVRERLTHFIETVRPMKPDIIIGAVFFSCQTFMKLAKELDFNAKAYLMLLPCFLDFLDDKPEEGKYVIGSGGFWDPNLKGEEYDEDDAAIRYYHFLSQGNATSPELFQNRYVERFGTPPNSWGILAYMAGILTQYAVEKANSLDPEDIRNAADSVNIKGVGGPIQLDIYGRNVAQPVVTFQLDDDYTPQILIPLASVTKELVYPAPKWSERRTTYGWYKFTVEHVMMAIASVVILLTLAGVPWIIAYRNRTVVRASQPVFIVITMFGSIIMYCTVFFWSLHTDDLHCNLTRWFIGIGFALLYSAIFARITRIAHIFLTDSLEIFKVTNVMIFPIVGVLTAIEAFILILWSIVSPGRAVIDIGAPEKLSDDFYTCQFENADIIFLSIILVYNACILLYGMIYVVRIWKIKAILYNESESIGFAVYTIAFTLILVGVSPFISKSDRVLAYVIRSLCFIFGPLITVLAILLPKVVYVVRGDNMTSGFTSTKSNMSKKSDTAEFYPASVVQKLRTRVQELEDKVADLTSDKADVEQDNENELESKASEATQSPENDSSTSETQSQ